jgi:hypothetical protein
MSKPFPSLLCILVLGALQCARPAPTPAEDFVSGYYADQRVLLLGESMEGPEGKLKPFDRMSPREIATIYHETWHAYFLECEMPSRGRPKGGKLFQAFRGEVDRLYPEHPAAKRMEIHEEAVADFIDAAVETYVQMKRFLASKTPAQRESIRKTTTYLDVYRSVFEDHYRGYYTKRISSGSASAGDRATTVSAGERGPSLPAEDRASTVSAEGRAISISPDPPATSVPLLPFSDAKTTLADFIPDARRFGLPVGYLRSAASRIKGVVFIRIGSGAQPPQADVVWAAAPLPDDDMKRVQRVLFEGLLTPDPKVVFAEERF